MLLASSISLTSKKRIFGSSCRLRLKAAVWCGWRCTVAVRQELPDFSGRHGAWQTNVGLVRSQNAM